MRIAVDGATWIVEAHSDEAIGSLHLQPTPGGYPRWGRSAVRRCFPHQGGKLTLDFSQIAHPAQFARLKSKSGTFGLRKFGVSSLATRCVAPGQRTPNCRRPCGR
jgi:hypothetical protein